jgi:hypothetical protein
MSSLDPEEYRNTMLDHYKTKLAMETERFGVKAVLDEGFEHNHHVVSGADLWQDLAKQLGLKIAVGDDVYQNVWVVVSESEVPNPYELVKLYRVIADVEVETDDEAEKLWEDIENFDTYEGPYKIDVDPELFEPGL